MVGYTSFFLVSFWGPSRCIWSGIPLFDGPSQKMLVEDLRIFVMRIFRFNAHVSIARVFRLIKRIFHDGHFLGLITLNISSLIPKCGIFRSASFRMLQKAGPFFAQNPVPLFQRFSSRATVVGRFKLAKAISYYLSWSNCKVLSKELLPSSSSQKNWPQIFYVNMGLFGGGKREGQRR